MFSGIILNTGIITNIYKDKKNCEIEVLSKMKMHKREKLQNHNPETRNTEKWKSTNPKDGKMVDDRHETVLNLN